MQIINQTETILVCEVYKNMKRFEKGICIFCIIAGFIAAYIIGYKIGNDEDTGVILKEEIESEKPYISEGFVTGNGETAEASENSIILSEESVLVIETCREDDSNITSAELKLPVEMIGLDREGVVSYLEENGDYFQEESEEIINIMLVSFSEDRVVIRKNVREGQVTIYPNGSSERYNYYIALEQDKVVVYKKDKETVFIETGITYDMLEKETRESIEEGVWIENISVLYRYLESITS